MAEVPATAPADRHWAAATLPKGGLAASLSEIDHCHPDRTWQLWWQDEAWAGENGRGARVWLERGVRPVDVINRRYTSAWMYAAVRPGTDQAFALVLTETSAAVMAACLERFQ